jgi:protein-disulfide isomerase-like protein with CxxC motif
VKKALAPFRRLVIDNSKGDKDGLMSAWGARAFPSLVFVGTDGEVVQVMAGAVSPQAVISAARRAAAR